MERMYKVGYLTKELNEDYCRDRFDRVPATRNTPAHYLVYRDGLKPMTHRQALTFISKQMEPARYFVYEVPANVELSLDEYAKKFNIPGAGKKREE